MFRKIIANVEFRISHDPIFEIHDRNPAASRFFTDNQTQTSGHPINIDLRIDSPPFSEKTKTIFRADNVWSIRHDGRFHFIVFHPPEFEEPLWIARCEEGFSKVTVYCGKYMTDHHHGRIVLYDPVVYPLDQILLMLFLAEHQGGIFHAAGWAINGRGCIFCGKSGAGKTTIADLLASSGEGRVLSDDRMAVRKADDRFLAYGTPWPGEGGFAENRWAPLYAIFFLKQGKKHHIQRINPSQAVFLILPVASILWYDAQKINQIMAFLDDLLNTVPLFMLTFAPDKDVAGLLKGHMNG